jgi:hypothetical protein
MQGGKKGLLENSTNLCTGTHRAEADFSAQNSKVSDTEPLLKPLGCRKHGEHGKRGKR